MTTGVSPEDIIVELGGCGRYQISLSVLVHVLKIVVCWSQTILVYAMKTPTWWCIDGLDLDEHNSSLASITEDFLNSSRTKACVIGNNTKCSKFHYDPYLKTIISEFDLVCDSSWIPSTIASVQMGGVLAGNLIAGHVADGIGRKKPFFISLFLLSACNIVGSFSTSWVMFTVFMFFVGVGSGFFLTIQYNLLSEFTLARWRSWLIGFPSWPIQLCLFAVAAWRLRDWRFVQLVTGLMAVPCLATWWFVQESFRWYISQDRYKDAEGVVKFVAKINKHRVNELTHEKLHKISKTDTNKRMTVMALFKTKHLSKITCLSVCNWIALGFVGYGIKFGLPALSGNLFVNIVLFALASSPSKLLCIFLQNRFGRKAAIMIVNSIIAAGAVIAGILHYIGIRTTRHSVPAFSTEADAKEDMIVGFTMLCAALNGAAWGAVQTITVEMYPTVIRNIGFGFLSIFARIGAVIGPQVVFLSTIVPGLLYFVCSGISLFCVFVTIGLPETKSADLKDKLKQSSNKDIDNFSLEVKS